MAKMQPFWWFLPPVITCPSGEQLGNGGFETGAWAPWTIIQGGPRIVTGVPHTGIYSCYFYNNIWDEIAQTLATPLPVVCVDKFEMWAYLLAVLGTHLCSVIVTIYYTDGTTTEHDFAAFLLANPDVYILCDIKPYLTTGKTISSFRIKFSYNGGARDALWVDDVSLTGTG